MTKNNKNQKQDAKNAKPLFWGVKAPIFSCAAVSFTTWVPLALIVLVSSILFSQTVLAQGPEVCNDGGDNDADGLNNCADPDCQDEVGGKFGQLCELDIEVSCGDRFDNDADGALDCKDSDCFDSEVCTTKFVRGEVNLDMRPTSNPNIIENAVDIQDALYIANALFLGGPKIECRDAADANDDGELNISDLVYILNFNFLAGEPEPEAPFDSGSNLNLFTLPYLSGFDPLVETEAGSGVFVQSDTLDCESWIPEECTDGLDNDFDGDIDCLDLDCEADVACLSQG